MSSVKIKYGIKLKYGIRIIINIDLSYMQKEIVKEYKNHTAKY